MKFKKEQILKALETITVAGEGKNMVESEAVKNVMTFVYQNNKKDYLIDQLNNDRYNFILSQINKYINI